MNISCIVVDKPVPGLTGLTYNKCTTLADVLAALAANSGVDIYAVSGALDGLNQNIVITLSNGSTFNIPVALLLPVVADGLTITGNGTTGSALVGYAIGYNAGTGELTITPPGGAPVVAPAQTATTEAATDTHNLLGLGAGAATTTQVMMDALAQCCLDGAAAAPITIPDAAFADPAHPTDAEATTWVQTNHPNAPQGQLFAIPTYGGVDANYTIWEAGGDNSLLNIEDPTFATVEIPAVAFANPANPTQAEAEVWMLANGPFAPGTIVIYAGNGTPLDPDWAWLINDVGDSVQVEAPPTPALVASFERTSKIGLTAAFDAGSSYSIGVTTYQWDANGPGAVSFGAPTAQTTSATFSEPGQYEIILSVTDGVGNVATETEIIVVARLIEVNGASEDINDFFDTLSAALAWISANGAPSAANRWLVRCYGSWTETATINALAHVDVYFVDAQMTSTAALWAVVINAADTKWSANQIETPSIIGGDYGVLRHGINTDKDASLEHIFVRITGFDSAIQWVSSPGGVLDVVQHLRGEALGGNGLFFYANNSDILVLDCLGLSMDNSAAVSKDGIRCDVNTGRKVVLRHCVGIARTATADRLTCGFFVGHGLAIAENCSFYSDGVLGGADVANNTAVGAQRQAIFAGVDPIVRLRNCVVEASAAGTGIYMGVNVDLTNSEILNCAVRGAAISIFSAVAWLNAKVHNNVLSSNPSNVTPAAPVTNGSNVVA